MSRTIIIVCVALAVAGCANPFAERQAQVATINAFVEQARRNGEAAAELKRTDMYVIAGGIWFCPTAEEAKKQATCAGGKRFDTGEKVTVIGRSAAGGVWRSEIWDKDGSHPGFVAAANLNELPDTRAAEEFAHQLDKSVREDQRIAQRNINYEDFIRRSPALKERKLVLAIPSKDMRDFEASNGALTFHVWVPAEAGSRRLAPIAFHLRNAKYVEEFKNGKKTYACGPAMCDELVLVAELQDTTVDIVDPVGNDTRLPLFDVVTLADRFGTYSRDR